MDILKNKTAVSNDYDSRYNTNYIYYNTEDDEWIMGIGSNVKTNNHWVAHKVKPTDTLDYLALKYYANPTFWWKIAYYNNIQDAFIKLSDYFDIIKIPNMTSIEFGNGRH